MRFSSSLHMPPETCQFGDILEIWGDAAEAYETFMTLPDYASRVATAHSLPMFATGWCLARVQGPPCPDYSLCGKRQGVEGGTFPTMLAAGAKARLTHASLCVVENVPGLPTNVVADSFGSCYECQRFEQCPADVGFDLIARSRTGPTLAK